MAGVAYDVRARIHVDPPRINRVREKLKGIGQEAKKVSKGLGDSIGGGVMKGFGPLLKGGAVYLALQAVMGIVQRIGSAFGALFNGVANAGSAIEDNRNKLAVLLAQGFDIPLDEAVNEAAASFDRLREQAKKLPGSLDDALGSMSAFAQAAGLAGASLSQIERLAGLSVVAGAVSGVDPTSAGGQIRKAIEENATSGETPLVVSTLQAAGMGKDEFNKLGQADRFTAVLDAFERFGGAIDLASMSWSANWATLTDTLGEVWASLSAVAFDDLKASVADLNEALGGEGLTDAAYAMGTIVSALVQPFVWLADGVARVGEVFSAMPVLADYLTLTFSEIGDDLTELGDVVGELLITMGAGLIPVVTILGTALSGLLKGVRIIVEGVIFFGDLLWQSVKWLASWVPGSGVESDFAGAGRRYMDAINDVFAVERREREKAAQSADDLRRKDAGKKLQVEVKLSQKVEWGEDRSLVVANDEMLTQLVEHAARWGAESAHGLPRYA